MRILLAVLVSCVLGNASAAESASIVIDADNSRLTIVFDYAAVKAEYEKKKTESGLSDAALAPYIRKLVLDAAKATIERARAEAEQTDAEREADKAATKARVDAEFARRAAVKASIEIIRR
jgi:hypothetical protein